MNTIGIAAAQRRHPTRKRLEEAGLAEVAGVSRKRGKYQIGNARQLRSWWESDAGFVAWDSRLVIST